MCFVHRRARTRLTERSERNDVPAANAAIFSARVARRPRRRPIGRRCVLVSAVTIALAVLLLIALTARPLLGGLTREPGMAELTLVAVTFFRDTSEPRFRLTARTCHDAASRGVQMVVIDASDPAITDELRTTGVHVVRQQAAGKKGVALREGIAEAARMAGSSGIIGFFEPEKLGMVGFMLDAAAYLRQERLDVVVPRREPELFGLKYPAEQFHQESFTNLYLDALAAPHGFPRGLDWTFGPVLFDARLAHHWLEFDGPLWDAQVIPYVRAVVRHGARIGSFEVPYAHPKQMKQEEEGKHQWAQKRYEQLHLWVTILPGEFGSSAASS